MLTKQELQSLLDVLAEDYIPEMTFDQCFAKFGKQFSRADWFKACTTLCFLLEA